MVTHQIAYEEDLIRILSVFRLESQFEAAALLVCFSSGLDLREDDQEKTSFDP